MGAILATQHQQLQYADKYVKRDILMCKETYLYTNRPTLGSRTEQASGVCGRVGQKRPIYVKRDKFV